jgi:aspartate aminotransferase
MGSRNRESIHTIFNIDTVPQAPEDSHYGLRSKYLADKTVDKLDLVIGAYRDGDGKPWVLPVVKKVSMHNASSISHPTDINYSFISSRQTIFSV